MLLKPPTVLLMGPPGSGKSYSATTYVQGGAELFVLLTEPNGIDSVMKSARERKLDLSRIHWRTLSPKPPGWSALLDQAEKVSLLSYQAIQDLKGGMSKELTRQYTELLRCFANFVDDNGRSWGDVTEWGDDRALVIDSLTGINDIIMDQTIGYKPVANQSEWQLAMNMQKKLLLSLTSDVKCHFAVLAHTAMEADETVGNRRLTADALGSKNAKPILGRFGNVVHARREGAQYLWSTTELNADTKQGNFPLSASIPPSFAPLVVEHRERVKAIQAASGTPA